MDKEKKSSGKDARKKKGSKQNAMTIPEFCKRNRLSRSTFYALAAEDMGPKTMKIGKSVRISRRAERQWTERMESGDADDFNSNDED